VGSRDIEVGIANKKDEAKEKKQAFELFKTIAER
jgi:hypothetical protein